MKSLKLCYSIFIALFIILTTSCSLFQSEESKIKKIIEAEIQTNANDPSSYSFVDMDIEKVTYNDLIQPTIESNRNMFQTEHYLEFQSENLDKLNRVAYYRVNFSYREKNRMGGLELFKKVYDLKYDDNGKLNTVWSQDQETLEQLSNPNMDIDLYMALLNHIYSGDGRSLSFQELEEMGLRREGWFGF